jgi:hypothetical protein
MSRIFTDRNTGQPLLEAILPEDFVLDAYLEVEQYPLNQKVRIYGKAVKDSSFIYYQSGDTYLLNKDSSVLYNQYIDPSGSKDQSGNYYTRVFPSIQKELDGFASSLSDKVKTPGSYFEFSDPLREKAEAEFQHQISETLSEMQLGAQISSMSVTTLVRNYLLDGGLAAYETDKGIVAVCLYRIGLESDILQGPAIIEENLSGKPFSKAEITYGTVRSSAAWSIPYIVYMVSDRKEDLSVFMNFAESVDLSAQVKAYSQQLHQQVVAYQTQMAQMQTAQTQAQINTMWAQQQQAWAASDRLRDAIHQDLDSFHNNLNQTMAENDRRFSFNSQSESMDDRIQRWRHESMMGVETYERNDGSAVEYDNRADRVFENNLDQTQHFGTRHYYDDYVPEGWHEIKKK